MPSPRTYHLISGLPRSGFTPLSAILRQNPRFHAGISFPVNPFVSGVLNTVSAGGEFGPAVTPPQRRNMMRGLLIATSKSCLQTKLYSIPIVASAQKCLLWPLVFCNQK